MTNEFQMVEGFKHTEVGIIPIDWKAKPLLEICSMKSGDTITAKSISDLDIFPCYGGNGLRGYTSKYTHEGAFSLIGRQGALCGNVLFVSGKFYASEHAVVVTPKQFTDIKWLSYVLKRMNLNQYSESSAQPGLSIAKILILPIPLPPTKAEQTAIATALNDADALINQLEQLLAKKRNIKTGAMQELLRPKEGWEVKTLGEVADVVGGSTPSTFNSKYWNGHINWFTPTEIGYKKYSFESKRKITNEGLKNCSARMLPIGTILLTSRASIGDVSILMNESCTNQGFQSLITKEENNNEFLYYLILTLKPILLQKASGSTFLEISPSKLKSINVSIPKPKEQTRIAQILSDMDSEIQELEKKIEKYKMLKQGMMQSLLTGKIRLVGATSAK